jgi:hypothetical protein
MSEERIVRRKLSELPKDTQTDWPRVDAMTEEGIDAAARSDLDAQPVDVNAPDFWEEAVLVLPSSIWSACVLTRKYWTGSEARARATRPA